MPRTPKPGGAVFEPRSFADNRKKFGRTSSRLTVMPIQSPHQGAAELQHAITNRIREHILDQNMSLASFCAKLPKMPGLTDERFERINRGETMLTITDLMFWVTEIPDFADFVSATMRDLAAEYSSELRHDPTEERDSP